MPKTTPEENSDGRLTPTSTIKSPLFTDQEWKSLLQTLRLPPRQACIVRLLFDGCSDRQIASHLDISLPTLRTHLRRLFRKLAVPDRLGLLLHVFHTFRYGMPT